MVGAMKHLATMAVLLTAVLAPEASAAAKQALRCPDAKVPKVANGRFTGKCVAAPKPKKASIPVPSASRSAQLGAIADQLEQALAIQPKALARLEKKIGRKRAQRLIALGLDSW